MKRIVAVSMRTQVSKDYGEDRDALSHDWIRLLNRLGAVPILVPNLLDGVDELFKRVKVDAVLLSNGGDVSPLRGEAKAKGEAAALEKHRDATERRMVRTALKSGIPVLGVCRGMQALNVYFGGTLVRNLEEVGVPSRSHVGAPHPVTLDTGRRITVNSYHAQAVSLTTLAPPLRSFAIADGGLVEGYAHKKLPVWGIQWHPERPGGPAAFDRTLLKRWLRR